ncbi:MAG: hypothetical protein HC786_05175 [Richelia sp. CSU_2_1]|nr:hypothetical protein [Microcoleus sp. SU_5_3]NJL67051.1 hypothetical protein [Microcoleus sp. SM1_3_4]NJR21600.1 hypothetical protein [Richelia sp. CSU_2_1]
MARITFIVTTDLGYLYCSNWIDDRNVFYNKVCCYAREDRADLSIQNLQQAINLNPDKYREMAKTDSDFDSIRSHPKFQALIQE